MDTLNWGHPPSVGWRPAPRHPQSHCMPELPPAPTPPPPALSCHVLRWPPLCVTFRGSLPAQTIPSAAPRHWDSCAHCCKHPEPPSLTQPLAGGGPSSFPSSLELLSSWGLSPEHTSPSGFAHTEQWNPQPALFSSSPPEQAPCCPFPGLEGAVQEHPALASRSRNSQAALQTPRSRNPWPGPSWLPLAGAGWSWLLARPRCPAALPTQPREELRAGCASSLPLPLPGSTGEGFLLSDPVNICSQTLKALAQFFLFSSSWLQGREVSFHPRSGQMLPTRRGEAEPRELCCACSHPRVLVAAARPGQTASRD